MDPERPDDVTLEISTLVDEMSSVYCKKLKHQEDKKSPASYRQFVKSNFPPSPPRDITNSVIVDPRDIDAICGQNMYAKKPAPTVVVTQAEIDAITLMPSQTPPPVSNKKSQIPEKNQKPSKFIIDICEVNKMNFFFPFNASSDKKERAKIPSSCETDLDGSSGNDFQETISETSSGQDDASENSDEMEYMDVPYKPVIEHQPSGPFNIENLDSSFPVNFYDYEEDFRELIETDPVIDEERELSFIALDSKGFEDDLHQGDFEAMGAYDASSLRNVLQVSSSSKSLEEAKDDGKYRRDEDIETGIKVTEDDQRFSSESESYLYPMRYRMHWEREFEGSIDERVAELKSKGRKRDTEEFAKVRNEEEISEAMFISNEDLDRVNAGNVPLKKSMWRTSDTMDLQGEDMIESTLEEESLNLSNWETPLKTMPKFSLEKEILLKKGSWRPSESEPSLKNEAWHSSESDTDSSTASRYSNKEVYDNSDQNGLEHLENKSKLVWEQEFDSDIDKHVAKLKAKQKTGFVQDHDKTPINSLGITDEEVKSKIRSSINENETSSENTKLSHKQHFAISDEIKSDYDSEEDRESLKENLRNFAVSQVQRKADIQRKTCSKENVKTWNMLEKELNLEETEFKKRKPFSATDVNIEKFKVTMNVNEKFLKEGEEKDETSFLKDDEVNESEIDKMSTSGSLNEQKVDVNSCHEAEEDQFLSDNEMKKREFDLNSCYDASELDFLRELRENKQKVDVNSCHEAEEDHLLSEDEKKKLGTTYIDEAEEALEDRLLLDQNEPNLEKREFDLHSCYEASELDFLRELRENKLQIRRIGNETVLNPEREFLSVPGPSKLTYSEDQACEKRESSREIASREKDVRSLQDVSLSEDKKNELEEDSSPHASHKVFDTADPEKQSEPFSNDLDDNKTFIVGTLLLHPTPKEPLNLTKASSLKYYLGSEASLDDTEDESTEDNISDVSEKEGHTASETSRKISQGISKLISVPLPSPEAASNTKAAKARASSEKHGSKKTLKGVMTNILSWPRKHKKK